MAHVKLDQLLRQTLHSLQFSNGENLTQAFLEKRTSFQVLVIMNIRRHADEFDFVPNFHMLPRGFNSNDPIVLQTENAEPSRHG